VCLPQLILRQVRSQHGDGVRLARRMLEAGEDDALADRLQDREVVSQLVPPLRRNRVFTTTPFRGALAETARLSLGEDEVLHPAGVN
jgi:hypothetical protein